MDDRAVKRIKHTSVGRDVTASMVAGALAALVVTPFDVVTRRVQAGDFATSRIALASLLRNDGVVALFRGIGPTLSMFVSTNALYFPVYEQLRTRLRSSTTIGDGPIAPFLAGTIARVAVATLSAPLEYLRTHMQAQRAPSQGTGTIAVLRVLLRSGAGNLFSGLGPTLWRDVPHSAVYWVLVEHLRDAFGGLDRSTTPAAVHFMSAWCAGTVAAAATTPFDVIKTKMQKEANGRGKSVSLISREIWQVKGLRGFFAGLGPRVAKIGPASAVMLTVFEGLRKKS